MAAPAMEPAPYGRRAALKRAVAPQMAEMAAVTMDAAVADDAAYASNAGVPPDAGGAADDAARLIIKNGNIDVTVEDLAAARDAVTGIVTAANGMVIRSSTNGEYNVNMAVRVPAEAFDDVRSARQGGQTAGPGFRSPGTACVHPRQRLWRRTQVLRQLRKLGTVMNEFVSTEDVTEQFVDVKARLRALELTQAQLTKLMEQVRADAPATRNAPSHSLSSVVRGRSFVRSMDV